MSVINSTASTRMNKKDQLNLHQDFSKSDYYILSADFQGTTRLALQHFIWQHALGFSIHPSIPAMASDASIADVACGTALWLFEVGQQLGPSSDLHGFDVYLEQAPPQQWLPKNLELHKWNIFDDVPPEFLGKFDMVHVRLVTVVIKNNNPSRIMQNLLELLSECSISKSSVYWQYDADGEAEPGGYLQWDEVDVFDSFVVKASPDLDTPAMDTWCAWMSSPKGENESTLEDQWHGKAVDMLLDTGFQTANRHDLTDQFVKNMPLMRYNNDQLLMLTEQYARRVFASGHEKGMQLLKTAEGAGKDAEKGAIMIMPPLCWVARKAP